MKYFKHILIFLFLLNSRSGYPQYARKIDSLLKLVRNNPHDTMKARHLHRVSSYYENMGLYDSTYKYSKQNNNISRKINYSAGLASSYNMMAHYYSSKGMHDSAISSYDSAFRHYTIIKDKARIAGIYNNMGVLFKKRGNIPKALENYYKSLRLKEEVFDSTGIANSCANIGNLYDDNGDTATGHKFNMRALKIREKINDKFGLANSYLNEGLYYSWRNDFKNAERYFRKSLALEEELEDEEGIAIASYNIGKFYYKQKQYDEAEKLFRKALAISEKNMDPEGIANCNKILGDLNYEKGKRKEAISYYEKAYQSALQSNVKEVIFPIAGDLSTCYEDEGDYKKSLFYHKEWSRLKDTLFNQENIKKMAGAELKYEHEKEKLLLAGEQQKKEAIAQAENHKKNVIIICTSVLILAVVLFAFVLYRRLTENKKQKQVIEHQNKEIVDSIKYAKKIQDTLLVGETFITENISENFVLFKPKDIVSGDFYWTTNVVQNGLNNYKEVQNQERLNEFKQPLNKVERFYLAVCDSTGHGVPGAFMSLLNIGFLNEAVNEKSIADPDKILNYVREKLINSISKEGQKDGFDGILTRIDKHGNETLVHYASANNKSVLVSEGKLIELQGDRMPVGKGEKNNSFSLFSLSPKKGDTLYLFTDGYADQFGGKQGKKYKSKQLNELLLRCSKEPMSKQKDIINSEFEIWRNNLEQVDDVCLIGIRF